MNYKDIKFNVSLSIQKDNIKNKLSDTDFNFIKNNSKFTDSKIYNTSKVKFKKINVFVW